MKRGDIYIIKHRHTVGSEMQKARPAVVVSNDVLNATSGVVEVVYLTTKPKKDMPTHVLTNATSIPSLAICEQIDSVSHELIGECVGRCTPAEMAAIDRALAASLGLGSVATNEANPAGYIDYVRACTERDTYKRILDKLLAQSGGRKR